MNDPIHALAQIVTACRKAEERRRFSSAVADIHRIASDALLANRDAANSVLLKRVRGQSPHEIDSDALRSRREALGLSQPELARLLGSSVWTVRNWEQSKNRVPNFLHLALYCLEHSPPPGYDMPEAAAD